MASCAQLRVDDVTEVEERRRAAAAEDALGRPLVGVVDRVARLHELGASGRALGLDALAPRVALRLGLVGAPLDQLVLLLLGRVGAL